jgi:hypothetical protein
MTGSVGLVRLKEADWKSGSVQVKQATNPSKGIWLRRCLVLRNEEFLFGDVMERKQILEARPIS